jgi:hypothetical protein
LFVPGGAFFDGQRNALNFSISAYANGGRQSMELIQVARSYDAMINGAGAAPGGRLFASMPRWTEVRTPSVGEVQADGSIKPYPGGDWHQWTSGMPGGERYVAVHSINCDRFNHLWVVDDAAPKQHVDPNVRPKLVEFDLDTDKIVRVYEFDLAAAPPGSVLGHVRCDETHIYTTESHHGAIIVTERRSGRSRRILEGDPRSRADGSIVPIVEGKPFEKTGHVPIVINVNLLELSGGYLYFTCLFGPMLRRIPVTAVQNASLSAPDLGAQIEDVVPIPPCAGIMAGPNGNLYLSSFTQDAILRVNPAGRLSTVISDPRIAFPNEGCVGPDGFLYFPASQGNRIAMHQPDGQSRVQLPWEIFKIDLATVS